MRPSPSNRGCTAVMLTSRQRVLELVEERGPRERALIDDAVGLLRLAGTTVELLRFDPRADLRRFPRAAARLASVAAGLVFSSVLLQRRQRDRAITLTAVTPARRSPRSAEPRRGPRARCRTAGSKGWCAASGAPPRARRTHADQRRQRVEQFGAGADAVAQRGRARGIERLDLACQPLLEAPPQPVGRRDARAPPTPPEQRPARSPARSGDPRGTSRSGAPGPASVAVRLELRVRKKITLLAAHDRQRA